MAELLEFANARQPGKRRGLRVIIAIGISGLSLTWFISAADTSALSAAWAALSPGLFVLASAAFFANLAVRAMRLMLLSSEHVSFNRFLPWLRLSVFHQATFMLLPSGFADLGFPILARRTVGLSTTSAARTVLIYRLQDVWVLLAMGVLGLTLTSVPTDQRPACVAIILLLTSAGLVWSSDVARWATIAIARVSGWLGFKSRRFDRFFQGLANFAHGVSQPIAKGRRLLAALAAVGCWSAAAGAAWLIFHMIGTDVGPVEILVIVAGLNLAGAFASFTIAGLGVSEGGLAGTLMLLGHGAAEAVAIALVARPLLLINALFVCGVVECAFRILGGRLGRPSRQAEEW